MSRKSIQPTRQEDRPRSKGAVLLARTGLTSEEVARKIAVTEALVRHWRIGRRVPALDKRRSLATAYGIPPESWDEAATPRVVIDDDTPLRESLRDDDFKRLAARMFRRAESLVDEHDAADTALHRAKSLLAATAVLDRAVRYAGIPLDVTEAGLVRTPAFQRAVARWNAAVVDAVRPYPEAARAVADAFARLRREWR